MKLNPQFDKNYKDLSPDFEDIIALIKAETI